MSAVIRYYHEDMRTLLTTLHAKFIHNSLALPCIAAYCDDECGEFVIREYTVHEPKENILSSILDENPDVVGFSVYLWNRRETLELIDLLAVAKPGIKLVVGGPEVSFDGQELFDRHSGLTALVRGEGEEPMRGLLEAWMNGKEPDNVPRVTWRKVEAVSDNVTSGPMALLDKIPSPFQLGLVDTSRGFVYYETSRGCPYNCSFCMSALDDSVRSFSMQRIEADLKWLMEQNVKKIKLVDRTFNYDAKRALHIFRFILQHNKCSHFHFEIGAHLLNEETIELLESVPDEMFHFEIGVQSTLPETLTAIDRKVSLEKVLHNISELRRRTGIELHLDLIAGLPGEDYKHFLQSIDAILALDPHHLQIEPVKLLPGSPLRESAKAQNLQYDPNPPYTIVSSDSLDFNDIEKLKAISRLLDLSWNSGRLKGFLHAFAGIAGSHSSALELLALHLQKKGLFRNPLSQTGLFAAIWDFVQAEATDAEHEILRETLARDFALCERVIAAKAPAFFASDLTLTEQATVREKVQQKQLELRGQKTKLQFFASPFNRLDDTGKRMIHLFLYLTRSGIGREVIELVIPGDPEFSAQ